MNCDNCHKRPATKTAILNNKFGNYCGECMGEASRQHSAQSAQWHRDRDLENGRRDMLQPRDRHGRPSADFIREYPEQAEEIFTEDEIKNSGL